MPIAPAQATAGRRDRKKQQTRAALTAAALQLVAERGIEAVTVEEISEAADVSTRTFFNYFASKDDAVLGDAAELGAAVASGLAVAPAHLSALAAVRLAFDPLIERMQAESTVWFLRLRVIRENTSLLPRLMAGSARTERAMTEAISARVGAAERDLFPALLVGVTSAAFRAAMFRWAADGGTRPLAELVDEAFSALAAGLPDPPTRS